MKGYLIELDKNRACGKVQTGNDELGVLTIYFKKIMDSLDVGSTVEFEVITSRYGNRYAKYQKLIERNSAAFNTEDREKWYTWGENEEKDFIKYVVPRLSLDIRINPDKEKYKWAIDLYDYTNNRAADLKTQNTPFFTAGKYMYNLKPYNPSYTVTFNKKDYENYSKNYPECDIYFWVDWRQTSYKNIQVAEVKGVWRAPFQKMAEKILVGEVALHPYQNRIDDDHNAKDSYLFNLLDDSVFIRVF